MTPGAAGRPLSGLVPRDGVLRVDLEKTSSSLIELGGVSVDNRKKLLNTKIKNEHTENENPWCPVGVGAGGTTRSVKNESFFFSPSSKT